MKSKQEIREKIEEYREMQKHCVENGMLENEERYGIRVVELEWVLEDDE